jgi:hypothetical protein
MSLSKGVYISWRIYMSPFNWERLESEFYKHFDPYEDKEETEEQFTYGLDEDTSEIEDGE